MEWLKCSKRVPRYLRVRRYVLDISRGARKLVQTVTDIKKKDILRRIGMEMICGYIGVIPKALFHSEIEKLCQKCNHRGSVLQSNCTFIRLFYICDIVTVM